MKRKRKDQSFFGDGGLSEKLVKKGSVVLVIYGS